MIANRWLGAKTSMVTIDDERGDVGGGEVSDADETSCATLRSDGDSRASHPSVVLTCDERRRGLGTNIESARSWRAEAGAKRENAPMR